MSYHFSYIGVVLLITTITLSLSQNIAAYTKRDAPDLTCAETDIYSISAEPVNADGSKNYRLNIFSDSEEKRKIFSALRPLDGRLADVKINDIDNDNVNELVVVMRAEHSSTLYYDIFEFPEKPLSFFSIFLKLFKMFE